MNMNTVKTTVITALLLLVACGDSPVPDVAEAPHPSSSPEELFRQVTDAVLAVDAARYEFTVEGMTVTGDTLRYSAQGQAVLKKGRTGLEDASILLDYTLTYPDEGASVQATLAYDGQRASHFNRTDSSFVIGMTADGGASIVLRDNVPAGAVLREFLFTAEPFGAELGAAGYSQHEVQEKAGRTCWGVTVDMPPYTSTWWVDTLTMLPVENSVSVWSPDGMGMEYTITLLEVETGITTDPSMFSLSCPEGIEEVRLMGSLQLGSEAPNWTLETPGGGTVSLSGLRGKVVVMDFWATWCGPCRTVMPILQELHQTGGEDLEVLGINVWERGDPVAFMEENGYTYTLLLGGDQVAADYLVEGIPTFYVIDRDGRIAFHAVGADPANEEALREIVGTLLAE